MTHSRLVGIVCLALAAGLWTTGAQVQNVPPAQTSSTFTSSTARFNNGWRVLTSGTTDHLRSVHFIDANTGWAAGLNGTIVHTADGGEMWSRQNTGTTEDFFAVRFLDPTNGWAGGGQIIARTVDGGQQWGGLVFESDNPWHSSLFPLSPTTAWAVGWQTNPNLRVFYFYTVDSDGNIDESISAQPSSDKLAELYFADAEHGLAVGEPGSIARILFTGSFVIFTILNSNTSESLFGVFMLDEDTAWVVGSNGTILKTTDRGDNWEPQTSGSTVTLRDVHFVDENRGWVVGDSGTVLVTENGGATWAPQPSGVTNDLYEVHFVDQDVGYAVGNDGTVLKYTTGPATAVEEQTPPTQFALFQNFPNPFNPSTEIRFDLLEAEHVRLVIYNAMGQEVARLVDQPMRAGTHAVTWDASGLPSGLYLYRLTADAFTETKAMTLLK